DIAYNDATKRLIKNKKTVEQLAQKLLEKETLTGEEIREIIFGKKKTVKKVVENGKPRRAKTKKQ
ncbi:MAG: hypothetical protein UIH99_04450, partial [Alphaproteobacteria bacterium]|nr:hypothetical protein [Alphaproteobacteria bacterium]